MNPPATTTPQKTQYDIAVDTLRQNIGEKILIWLSGNEPSCIHLLICSEVLLQQYSFWTPLFKVFPTLDWYKEYSFVITPSAKAYEGFLIYLMRIKGEISEEDLKNKYLSVSQFYKSNRNGASIASKHLLRGKDKRLIDKLYGDWQLYRNKVLHFDKDFFVTNPEDAKKIVRSIQDSIKTAYKMFVDNPD